MSSTSDIAFIAWTRSDRPAEIARAIGGVAHTVYLPRLVRPALVPARYVLSAVRTTAFLLRTRPRVVVVSNPPAILSLLAAAYCRAAKARLILDSHPIAFGRKQNLQGRLFEPVHRRLLRRAAAVMVASEPLAELARTQGGRPIVFHEAPPLWAITAPSSAEPPTVLWVGVFNRDEPIADVIEAARQCPDVAFSLTGDPWRCPAEVRDAAPTNVTFTGYRSGDAYRALVAEASALLVLTTDPASVPRSAVEAVAARRPLVLSDHPQLRELFPGAVFVGDGPEAIAAGIREALTRHAELLDSAERWARAQEERYERQRAALLDVLQA